MTDILDAYSAPGGQPRDLVDDQPDDAATRASEAFLECCDALIASVGKRAATRLLWQSIEAMGDL